MNQLFLKNNNNSGNDKSNSNNDGNDNINNNNDNSTSSNNNYMRLMTTAVFILIKIRPVC